MHDSLAVILSGLPPLPEGIRSGGHGVAVGLWQDDHNASVLWLYRRADGTFVTYQALYGNDDGDWVELTEAGSGGDSFPIVDDRSGAWVRWATDDPGQWAIRLEQVTIFREHDREDGRTQAIAGCARAGVQAVVLQTSDGREAVVECHPVTGVFIVGRRGEEPLRITAHGKAALGLTLPTLYW